MDFNITIQILGMIVSRASDFQGTGLKVNVTVTVGILEKKHCYGFSAYIY